MAASMERMTTAQAIVRYLSQQWIERDGVEQRLFKGMFGIFGHGNVTGIGQALEEVGADLPYYRPQNEQAMVHTAVAYAKAKNRLQMFACTSSIGPGATNMVTGAAVATVNRLPVLLLPGDIFASRRPDPVLQQLEHSLSPDISVNDCFRPVSRFWDRIYRPEQILDSLPEAIRVLTDPAETGAVTLALPQDVQTEALDVPASFLEKRVIRLHRATPVQAAIAEAVDLLRSAKLPLIIAGGGAIYSEASDDLGALAERFGIPVAETQAGKGVLPWDHPWNVGPIGSAGGTAANKLARDADLVIAIGTRLADFTTASHTAFANPDVRFVSVNVSSADAHKLGSLPIIGDARETIRALSEALSIAGVRPRGGYAESVGSLKSEWDAIVDGHRTVSAPKALTQANVIGIVNEESRPQDTVVCAAGGMPGDLLKLWRPLDPKGYHVEYGYSCMGYEIAGGLGVKLASPDGNVFVMVGDGSYLMMHTEIVTSLQEDQKLIIVVVDNGGFQCIRGLQMQSGSPAFGNELRVRNAETNRLDGPYLPVDFAQNAASLGANAILATDEESLRAALRAAEEADRTTVIHIRTSPDDRLPGYESWWDVPIAEESGEDGVRAARVSYLEAKERQRLLV